MNNVESRRIVPIARITIGLVVILALYQAVMLSGLYEVKASTVKKTAPWFYSTFRKWVGEDPSTRPVVVEPAEEPEEKGASAMATVAGFKPEELDITIEDVENPSQETSAPVEEAATVIPVSEPEEPAPVDENIPVG